MKHCNAGIAAAATSWALAASATAGPPVITQPDWVAKPTGELLARHYPDLASHLGLAGYAVLSCGVSAEGSLVDCRADTERPAGLGFGQAAVAMGGEFRMRPQTINGQPSQGGTVRIPIRFVLPSPETPTLPPPVSEEATRQALRIVDAAKAAEQATAAYEALATRMQGLGEDPAIGRAAAEAFRRAVSANREELRTTYARAFASVFSESEMAAIADFAQASGDQKEASKLFAEVQTQVMADYARDLTAKSHAAFCAKVACGGAADVLRVWRPSDPRDADRIDIPQWGSQPSEATLQGAAPKAARSLGLTGVARLTCKVALKGALEACVVDEQAPAGLGYGAAALAVADRYRLSRIQLATGAVGRRVTVRIGFPPPEPREPLRLKPGPAGALALARQIVAQQQFEQESRLKTELEIADAATNPPKDSDPKTYEAALEAYRVGAQAALADYIDVSATNLSSAYSESQLARRAAYEATPAGKAQRERSKELGIALGNAQLLVSEKITAAAHAAFCEVRDCSTPASVQAPKAVSSAPSTRTP